MKTFYKLCLFGLLSFTTITTIGQKKEDDVLVDKAFKIASDNPDAAIRYCNSAIKINPDNTLAYYTRGLAFSNKKLFDNATNDFNKAIKLYPQFTEAYSQLGIIYNEQENYSAALSYLTKGIEVNPANSAGYWFRARYYNDNKNYEKAIVDLTKAIKILPTFGAAYGTRAISYYALSNFRAAILDNEKAIQLDPEESAYYLNLITGFVRNNQAEKANAAAKRFKAKNFKVAIDGSWSFYNDYIAALLAVVLDKDYNTALAKLKASESKVLTNDAGTNKKDGIDNGLTDVLFLKAYVYEQLGEFDLAKNAYQQSFILNRKQKDIPADIERLEQKAALVAKTDNTPPEIQIFSPTVTTRSIDIVPDAEDKQILKGIVKDASGVQSVTVNGKKALTLESNGEFTQPLQFTAGVNTINIEAFDKNGNKATKSVSYSVNKTIAPVTNKVDADKMATLIPSTNTYHAIIIGEADYITIPKLNKPVKDAREMKTLLETKYTFDPQNIVLLENKSRRDILGAIFSKCATLGENDNLLIFYAGHGVSTQNEGYWIPVEAEKGSVQDYIPFRDIKTALETSAAKHILIIADACFAGALTRGLGADAPIDIVMQAESKSRKAMTSGNDTPVDDNSWFLYHLKEELKETHKKYISASELFNTIQPFVLRDSNQDNGKPALPVYNSIPGVGDRNGTFIFVKR